MSLSHPDSNAPSPDWDTVRSVLRRRIGGRLDPTELAELDDLVQEGCIRVLRVSRREAIEDLEGLTIVIADRTFGDYLRRRYRNERLWKRLEESEREIPDAKGVLDNLFGDAVERLEFAIMEIFSREGRADCGELARTWFANRTWRDVAEEEGVSHASIRKRWSRCLELSKKALRSDPDYRHLLRLR